MSAEIRQHLMRMIEEAKPVSAPVTVTSNLYTDLGFDSLAFMRLLLKIEESYSIAFALMEMGWCVEVERLLAIATEKIMESGGEPRRDTIGS